MKTLLNNPVVWFLGLIITNFVSASVARISASKDKVNESTCKERRDASDALIAAQLKALHDKMDILIENNRARLASHETGSD